MPLSQGQTALIDREDARLAGLWIWTYERRSGYARRTATRSDGTRHTVYLHRIVLRAKRHDKVDHRSGDKLDCRKDNLRLATVQENARNVSLRPQNRSGITGVSFDTREGRWRAVIVVGGRQKFLGYTDTPEEARLLRERAERDLFGEFSPLARDPAP